MLVQPIDSRPRQAVWGLGFRPFFLGGSLFALLALLFWAGVLAGTLEPTPAGGMLAWHRHEMLYGFAVAIIAGLLLTSPGAAWATWPRPLPAPGWTVPACCSA